jgi:RNA polymerase sigma-70 factor (ECF subfamily)
LVRSKPLFKGIDAMTRSDPSAPAENRLATDQPAITCLKQGDLTGLATLVQYYQVEAVHAALLIVWDRGTAEEIVQEAFLQAYRKIGQFDDHRPFGPWFLRIVINAALKAADRQKRSVPIDEAEDGRRGTDSRVAEWLIDPCPGPEELAETDEMRETVWQALEQLTPDQRAAVVLRYFLDQDEREMIQALDRPLTTVKWWLHAARKRLRKLLHPIDHGESERQEVVDREVGDRMSRDQEVGHE